VSAQHFHSNGKLLLSGEYLVIDGAKALAIPTKKGQSLTITKESNQTSTLQWKSLLENGESWLDITFSLPSLKIIKSSDTEKSLWLQKLLVKAKSFADNFLITDDSITVTTQLDFSRNWGLGSSSTLINNVAQWANIDPFELHFSISNGSGYDVACASINNPIIYQTEDNKATVDYSDFNPPFSEQLFFIHLNQKQNSFDEVESYSKLKRHIDLDKCISEIDLLTNRMVKSKSLPDFEEVINQHEYLLSNILQKDTIKETLFPLYKGTVKSLGAWGGDFILVTGIDTDMEYFKQRNYSTIIPFQEMTL